MWQFTQPHSDLRLFASNTEMKIEELNDKLR
jgi:hypothetical protein